MSILGIFSIVGQLLTKTKMFISKEVVTMEKRVYHELNTEIYNLRISRKDIADECNISYSSLSSYLNGFTPMPDAVYKKLLVIIDSSKKAFVPKTQSRSIGGER